MRANSLMLLGAWLTLKQMTIVAVRAEFKS